LRLPRSLQPEHYLWQVKVALPFAGSDSNEDFKIFGNVTIQLKCVEKTNVIVLHANILHVNEKDVRIYDAQKTQIELDKLVIVESTQMIHVHLKQDLLPAHVYNIQIYYTGPVSGDVLSGIYRGKYTNAKGEQKYVICCCDKRNNCTDGWLQHKWKQLMLGVLCHVLMNQQ
jgi:hypothetical protein